MSSTENNELKVEIHQDASDETVGYQAAGWALLEEKFLVCPNCNKKLVSIVLVKEDNSPPKVFQAFHVKCNMKSFKLTVTGHKAIYQAVPPFSIIDMETNPYTKDSEFIVK